MKCPFKRIATYRGLRSSARRCLLMMLLAWPPFTFAESVVAGVTPELPPYASVRPDGQASGFSVELLKAVAAQAGLKIQFRVGSESELLTALDAGEIQILSNLAFSAAQDRAVDFGASHSHAHDARFVRLGTSPVQLAALNEGRALVVEGDFAHEYLRHNQVDDDRIILGRSVPEILKRLAAGEGDYALAPHLPGLVYLGRLGLDNLETYGDPVTGYQRSFAFAVAHGDDALLARLEDGLRKVRASGEFARLHSQWLRDSPDELQPWQHLGPRLLGTSLALAITLFAVAIAFVLTRRRLHRVRSDFMAFQNAVLDSLPERLAVLDPEGRVAIFNAAWMRAPPGSGIELEYRHRQWELRSLCGQDASSTDGKEVAAAVTQVASGARDGCEIEYPCVTPNGRKWFELQGRRFLFGERPHILLIQSDITQRKSSEQRLHESQEKFARAFHSAPIGVVVTTRDEGRFLEVNDAFERITGYFREELIGRPSAATMLLAETKRHDINERLEREGRIEGLECVIHTKGRGTVPIRYFGEAIEVGGEPCILSVVEDISVQAQALRDLAAREEQFRTLVQNVTGAVFRRALDDDWTMEFLSDGIQALSGYPARAFIGNRVRPFAGIIHPEDRDQVEATVHAATEGGRPYVLEYRILHADGRVRWVGERGCGAPTHAGKPARVDGVLFDVSAAKTDQEALVYAREAADAANRAKSAFLANMSHELRTPLNAIMGYAQILQRDPSLGENHHQAATTIQRSCDHLLLLINDILDLAKIEAGRFELIPTSCNLDGFLTTIVQMFRIRAEQKGIVFHHRQSTPLPRQVEVDEKRLRQVVMNLLGNAVKFTEQGEVILETAYQDSRLVITVSDTGIGIPSEKMAEVFQPFHQAGNERYRTQGTGLGLAISRQLVHAMGGDISVASQLGRGSRFSAIVPVIEQVDAARRQTPICPEPPRIEGYRRTDGEAGPFRILVVDDAEDSRLVVRDLLAPYGFEIAEAQNGGAAVEKALGWQPDFVLMDVVLPDISGHVATQRIQQQCAGTPPVIAAWSSSAFAEDIEASLDAGCCMHLTKPVRLELLLKALKNHLPLEWIEPKTQGPQQTSPLNGTPLAAAALASLSRLYQRGDLILLRKEVERQLDQHPGHPCLITLLDAARRFDLRAVRSILSPPLN